MRKNLSLILLPGFIFMLVFSRGIHAEDQMVRHIMVLGNSIALHSPRLDIGWTGNWGMAASNTDHDFAHLLQVGLARKGQLPKLVVINLSIVEKQYRQDVSPLLRKVKLGADLVVVELGDNVPMDSFDPQKWYSAYEVVLNATVMANSRLICVSTWGGNVAVDKVIQSVCASHGGQYADIHRFKKDLSNRAGSERYFENAGVASHPGDEGMRRIAQAVLEAYHQFSDIPIKGE